MALALRLAVLPRLRRPDGLPADAIFSALAAVIVFAFIGVITRSPFLTCMAVLQIALSFPSAFFFYKLVIGIEYFPFLNFLGLFVICGIGADDIFVLYEKWDQHVQADPDADTEDIASKALPDAVSACGACGRKGGQGD